MLIDRLKNYNVILASQSPRRLDLLRAMGINFSLAPAYEVLEVCPDDIKPEEQAGFLSKKKAAAYPRLIQDNEIVITADTLVIFGDKVLGKPTNRDEAIKYLTLLSGATHKVITGVTIKSASLEHTIEDTTTVTFSELNIQEIEFYVDNLTPLDKAGAYAIQEWIGIIGVEEIVGTYFNIMGLPTNLLYREMAIFLDKLEQINLK